MTTAVTTSQTAIVFDLLVELKHRLVDALVQPVRQAAVYPGAIAWDACEDCGLLAVSSTRLFASEEFPLESASSYLGTANVLGVDATVQVVRCAPSPQGEALSPTTTALENSAYVVNQDAIAVFCAASDLFDGWVNEGRLLHWLPRELRFVGPEGGCVGVEFNFAWGLMR